MTGWVAAEHGRIVNLDHVAVVAVADLRSFDHPHYAVQVELAHSGRTLTIHRRDDRAGAEAFLADIHRQQRRQAAGR